MRQKARRDAESLKAFIEDQLDTGAWKVGDRLPTERELVDRFGIARNTVRRTLEELEARGRIDRQVGRGTFAADGARPAPPPEVPAAPPALDASPSDVIEFRLLFEPAMAGLAVTRATQADVERLEQFLRRGDEAEDWRIFEHWDEALHQGIAEATRNPVVVQINRNLAQVRRQGEWGQLKARSFTPARRLALQAEHREIVRAIRDRDLDGAQDWMRRHLLHVRSYMFRPDGGEPARQPVWTGEAD